MKNQTEAYSTLAEFAAECGRIFGNLVSMITDYLSCNMQYVKADAEHPEWVHRAIYSKKKRIRKKYHDRIMRTYGQGEM